MVSYIGSVITLVILPLYPLMGKLGWIRNPPFRATLDDGCIEAKEVQELEAREVDSPEDYAENARERGPERVDVTSHKGGALKSHMYHARVGLLLSPFWFISQVFHNYSLSDTSMSSNSIIFQLAAIFTFILCVVTGMERFTLWKVFGVTASVVGSAMTMMGDKIHKTNRSVWGDIVSAASALAYAFYALTLQWLLGGVDGVQMQLVLGYMSLFNLFAYLPPAALLALIPGQNPFTSTTWGTMGLVVLKGGMDYMVGELVWGIAVLLTTPTIGSISFALMVPLTLLLDKLMNHMVITQESVVGSVLVITGFIVVGLRREDKLNLNHYSCPDEESSSIEVPEHSRTAMSGVRLL
ncbi:unnamed protein product [Discosporangium mesarthrocarpum]